MEACVGVEGLGSGSRRKEELRLGQVTVRSSTTVEVQRHIHDQRHPGMPMSLSMTVNNARGSYERYH